MCQFLQNGCRNSRWMLSLSGLTLHNFVTGAVLCCLHESWQSVATICLFQATRSAHFPHSKLGAARTMTFPTRTRTRTGSAGLVWRCCRAEVSSRQQKQRRGKVWAVGREGRTGRKKWCRQKIRPAPLRLIIWGETGEQRGISREAGALSRK